MDAARLSEFRALADRLPSVIFCTRPDGVLEFVNRRWYETSGLPRTEPPSDNTWAELVHPDDRSRVTELWSRAIASGEYFEVEFRGRRVDGSYRWMIARATPDRTDTGEIATWFGTLVDIGALKTAQKTVREREVELKWTEEGYQILAESVSQILWTADASGYIDWYNNRWYEYTGQTREEAAGWGWQAAHHPEDFPEVMKSWPHSIATGVSFEMEFRLRGGDGIFRWFLTRVVPRRDESGAIVRWYGTNTDIDAQKRELQRTARVAATLQEVFLPKSLPSRDNLRFDAVYVSAASEALVGGDWYDAFELPSGAILISIGDVAGHGLEASVTVGRVRQAIITAAMEDANPASVLQRVNRVLFYQDRTMVTGLVACFDPDTGSLVYASAGHPAPILAIPGKQPQLLALGGLPLGIEEHITLENHTSQPLPSDSVVVFYTDGVIEAERDIDAAETRLMHAAAALAREPNIVDPAEVLLGETMAGAHPRDDAALLVMQMSLSDRLNANRTAKLQTTWRFHSSDAHTARTSRIELVAHLKRILSGDEEPDLFATELIIGELLANTVEHAPGLVEVHLDWAGEQPIMRVRDAGPGGITNVDPALPSDQYDEDGRGLFLISQLAVDLKVGPAPGYGTEITVTLPLRRSDRNTSDIDIAIGAKPGKATA